MGLIYRKNSPEKCVYSAYNMHVFVKEHDYEWTIYKDKPTENCYTFIRICNEKNGILEDVYTRILGNRVIFEKLFQETIDNFLYKISSSHLGKVEIDKLIDDVLLKNNGLFNYQIENEKRKEKEAKEAQKRAEIALENERKMIKKVQDYCTKHKYFYFQNGGKSYILEPKNDKIMDLFQATKNTETLELYANFMENNPKNHEGKFIFGGNIEEFLVRI